MVGGIARTVPEWEAEVGRQIRVLRLRRDQTQADLARTANVSVSTLAALERGAGSSLSTMVAVARALGRADWLEQLAPPEPISPLAALEQQRRQERNERKRASGRRANRR
jgi:transcriptional regulator with XRE-family HTH domain